MMITSTFITIIYHTCDFYYHYLSHRLMFITTTYHTGYGDGRSCCQMDYPSTCSSATRWDFDALQYHRLSPKEMMMKEILAPPSVHELEPISARSLRVG